MTSADRTLVLDVETCNLTKTEKVQPGNNLTYDIGYQVVEPSTSTVLVKRSYVVKEIFCGERDRMASAYYADKLPQYYDGLANSTKKLAGLCDVLAEIARLCKEYNVKAIVAHNARFDVDALNTTLNYLYGWDFVRALPQNVEIWDTMKMWRAVMPKSYAKFCEENGFMTKHAKPQPQMKAETIYRFLTGNVDFEEEHTGLADVEIETEIMFACYRTHKKLADARVLYHSKE